MKKIFMVFIIIMILFLNLSVSFAYPQGLAGTNYFPSNMNELGYNDLIILANYNSNFGEGMYNFYELWIDTDSTMVQLYTSGYYKNIGFNDEYIIDVKYMDIDNNGCLWKQAMKSGSDGGEFILNYSNSRTYQIVYSSMNLYNKNGDLIYIPSSGLELNIVSPLDGFTDNSNLYNVYLYTRFPSDMNPGDITYEIKVNGLSVIEQGLYHELVRNVVYEYSDYLTNEVQFVVELPIGENIISVDMLYDDELMESDNVTVTRLSGFVDEDGDGLDDRTGQPYVPENPQYPGSGIAKPEKPGEEGTVIDWLKYLGEYIGYIFEILINSISNFTKNVVSGVGSVLSLAEPAFTFVNQFFSSMPVEIRTGIMAMFSISVFLVIMKMIRG